MVTPEEESLVHIVLDEVNTRLRQFQSEYTHKDVLDCVLMTLLTYAVDHHKALPGMISASDLDALCDIRDQLVALERQSVD